MKISAFKLATDAKSQDPLESILSEPSNKLELATRQAQNILKELMPFRRSFAFDGTCGQSDCYKCQSPHLQKVVSAIMQNLPIQFALPAFPGKSPNLAKVFGPLPDMAEQRALDFLNDLCNRLSLSYPPGAKIILCSDGRVFSDVVGMIEKDVSDYQDALDQMIQTRQLTNITTFNLDELCGGKNFDEVRNQLMVEYGHELEVLKDKIQRGSKGSEDPETNECHRIYCGITRFLFEDSLFPGQTKSRTSIQKDCRIRAYEVIRRSNAWSELIAERFPEAVRLSIHPQMCGSTKLGIQLLGAETWMTPWHGVAVDTGKGFILMKRWEAEKLEAELVLDTKGRASHYKIAPKNLVLLKRETKNEF